MTMSVRDRGDYRGRGMPAKAGFLDSHYQESHGKWPHRGDTFTFQFLPL